MFGGSKQSWRRRDFLARGGLGSLALLGGSLAEAAQGRLRAGVAKRRVTPPLWVPFLTSSGQGTHAPFQGVNDDLYARALVLDDGRQALAVLAVDAIGYDNALLGPKRHFTAEVRQTIARATGLRPEAIMLTSTHTHQAPETIGLTPFREVPKVPAWLEEHRQALADTVIEAWQKRVPVRAFAGLTRVTGLGRYRRIVLKNGTLNGRGPVPPEAQVAAPWQLDEDLAVLCLETEQGMPQAVLLNYTAHPIVTMLLPRVSADYPGAAAALVESTFKDAVCLFTQGAAGNINTVQVTTSFKDAATVGHRLGQAALEEIKRLRAKEPLAATALGVASEQKVLAARSCPALPEAEKAVKADPSLTNQRLLRLARKLAEGPIQAEVQAMRLGPVKWVSFPGEAFVETGLALKKAGASFVVGYANGWIGYLPLRRTYDEGGYEATAGPWSRVAPGSAEAMEDLARKMLARV